MRSKSIALVLTDGTPHGIRTAVLSNWDGKIICVPRSALKRLKDLAESERPAVYFLVGDEKKIYVGQTQWLKDRSKQHDASKDFWTELVAVTSPGMGSTEVQFLEALFAAKIKEAGMEIMNKVQPLSSELSREKIDVLQD